MEISIIIPIFNAEKTLQNSLDSIKKQTFTDFEVLMINDGSSDNSGEICEKYSLEDDRFITFHKKNGGVSSARNIGLKYSIGKYITFLDADDCFDQEMLIIMLSNLKKYKVDLAVCDFEELTDYSLPNSVEKIALKREQSVVEYYDFTLKKNMVPFFYLRTINRMVIWNKIFKKSIIDESKLIFDEDLVYGEDHLFCAKYYLKVKSVIWVKENLHYRIRHEENITNYYDNRRISSLEAYRRIISLLGRDFSDLQPVTKSAMLESSLHILTRVQSKKDYLELKKWVIENVVSQIKLNDLDTEYKNLFLSKLILIGMKFSPYLTIITTKLLSEKIRKKD